MKNPRFTDALGHGLTDKRIEILRGIGRSGSISQAARDASVSYKAAWQAIDTLTNLAGVELVQRAVGGAGGGGASLTRHGQQLLDLARELDAAKAQVQQRWLAASGAAGGAFGATPFALRTSMRNQLAATVTAVETVGPLSRVGLRIGAQADICARLTRESVELLGLQPGLRVIAMCKATSVRVTRAAAAVAAKPGRPAAAPVNQLAGKAAGIERGDLVGDEVSVDLGGAGRIVGFAVAGSGLRVGQRVQAEVDESAVVVALSG